MATEQEVRPVTIKDALIFVSKRAEDNIRRLNILEKTLEEVNGEEGGEKDFEKLQNLTIQHEEKVDSLLNRVTNLEEKNGSMHTALSSQIDLVSSEVEKLNSLREEVEKLNSMREEVEKLTSLREDVDNLEKLVRDSIEVEMVIKEEN